MMDPQIEAYMKNIEAQAPIVERLLKEGYSPVSAIIMAGDIQSRERADILFAEGKSVEQASIMVGSYSRFDWVVEQYWLGHIGVEELSDWICDLWRGADPDDTNPDFLEVWKQCSDWNGDAALFDEKPLPDDEEFTIYRGQSNKDERNLGISWSLSKEVATRFANGAAVRSFQDGYLATAKVQRSHIMAYITGRNEEELIIDPICVKDITWEFIPVPKRK